ncbi:hypothetical protein L218DRAFT_959169 [Marasmius fiardii PR-910]|nr:hypothetical protein L218DRAFT_959169 [Marasmius fiardii PR-910]
MSSSVRRASTSARIIRRYASSNTSSTPQKSFFLTPEKKRALISLYHQSDTFITPENLSERIDQAFIKRRDFAIPFADTARLTRTQMDALIIDRERAPKFSEWDRDRKALPRLEGRHWSEGTTAREWRVIEALYGVDSSDASNAMPGLEALEEFSSSEEALEIEKEEKLRNGVSES